MARHSSDSSLCWLRGCTGERAEGPFCTEHWEHIPEDMQIRIQWAHDEGTESDWTAAVSAAVQYLAD